MPFRCQKCNNPIATDGSCTKCDAMEQEVQTERVKRFLSPANNGAEPPAARVQATQVVPGSTSNAGAIPETPSNLPGNTSKYSNDDIMNKLTLMMSETSTKTDVENAITEAVVPIHTNKNVIGNHVGNLKYSYYSTRK